MRYKEKDTSGTRPDIASREIAPLHSLARFLPSLPSRKLVPARRPLSPVVTNTKYVGEKCPAPPAAPAPFSRVAGPAPDESLSDATNEPRIIFTRAPVFPWRCRRSPLAAFFPAFPSHAVSFRPPRLPFASSPASPFLPSCDYHALVGKMTMRIRWRNVR